MGLVSLSTLMLVQNSAREEDLGIVTSLHQFGRSLGGAVAVTASFLCLLCCLCLPGEKENSG